MKNHRFLWLRNRTTDNRKCEKARNIKEKRTIEMFNTVSKQLVAHLSSPKEIICATFGSSGNGLFAGFQELWMLLKSVWFWYISNKQVT